MKVVRVEPAEHEGWWWVTFTARTEGNRHIHEKISAQDAIQAYTRGLKLAHRYEVDVIRFKLADWELIDKTMPNAGASKEVKKLRNLLTRVNKFGEEYGLEREVNDDATTK